MNYANHQSQPAKRLVSFGSVIVLHLLLVWALLSGLAGKVVQVIRQPVEATIIAEAKPAAPEAPKGLVPPPPTRARIPPPPAAVPSVQVMPPAPAPQETITAAVAEAPPAPPQPAPPSPAPAPAATEPRPAPAPAKASAAVVCSNYSTVMGDAAFPRDAVRQGLDKGGALVQFTLGPRGEIKDVKALRATHPIFARHSMRIVQEYKCAGQGQDMLVEVPFEYGLK